MGGSMKKAKSNAPGLVYSVPTNAQQVRISAIGSGGSGGAYGNPTKQHTSQAKLAPDPLWTYILLVELSESWIFRLYPRVLRKAVLRALKGELS